METLIDVTPPGTALAADPQRLDFLKKNGYVVIPHAISGKALDLLRDRFDQIIGNEATTALSANPSIRMFESANILERDPLFAELMDWPSTFPYARALIGRDITLTGGGAAYWQPPGADAFISWHNDFQWMVDVPFPRQNFWVRLTYFIDDITEERGPFTLLPGTHLRDHACPSQDMTAPNGQPLIIPGQVAITGKAGTCLINNTEIWHTNTPNRSTSPRKVIMFTYKHSWMRTWDENFRLSPKFIEAQTSPLRRQLCGLGGWHRFDSQWDA